MQARQFYVLCVDDEAEILTTLGDIVRAQSLIPLLAKCGTEALLLIEKHQRDLVLVLSDYQMPDFTGLELRQKMSAEQKHIPFLIISGHISREDALKAVDLKISGFAEKPFTRELLANLIKEHSVERLANLRDEAELIQGFIADAENLIEEMESLLLVLEGNPADMETINRIFAIAHTIKGASGFFQPKTIHRFTHAFEDFLSPYKKNALPVPPSAISVLLKGIDTIKSLLNPLRTGEAEPKPLEELLKVFVTQEAPAAPTNGTNAAGASDKNTGPAPRDEIKVPISVLDEFMELSGEITVVRNMINKLVRAIEKEIPGNRNVNLLSELLDEMHKINSQMQDKVVDLRKLSCKNIFRPLKRAVRDLSGNLKKEVRFDTSGEELRVDTAIAEILGNSLIHMVRNCVDHGIETPEVRKAAGKDSEGLISIEAMEKNNEVIVTIRDDGKGIDPEVIRKKVVEKGLRTREAAAKMTISELQNMIFESGFSTAAQVTDVSGRGVGMDMVKKAVTGGGGQIRIESAPGKGSCIQLVIPVPKMVTIISSLMVRVGRHFLAIPQENILRLLSVSSGRFKQMIRCMEGADFLLLDNALYPILRLESVLENDQAGRFSSPKTREETKFALVGYDDTRFAIILDEIFDAEDTVVKKLGRHLQDLSIFRGATFLGDGKVGLILDVPGLGKFGGVTSMQSALDSATNPVADPNAKVRSLLLIELQQPGSFGIFLDDVFRLESTPASEIQQSGKVKVMIYRGRTCPFFFADELLGYSSRPMKLPLDQENIPTLILTSEHGNIGIGVKAIVDLVATASKPDGTLSDRLGLAGALIENSTVTVLDLSGMLQLSLKYSQYLLPPPVEKAA